MIQMPLPLMSEYNLQDPMFLLCQTNAYSSLRMVPAKLSNILAFSKLDMDTFSVTFSKRG